MSLTNPTAIELISAYKSELSELLPEELRDKRITFSDDLECMLLVAKFRINATQKSSIEQLLQNELNSNREAKTNSVLPFYIDTESKTDWYEEPLKQIHDWQPNSEAGLFIKQKIISSIAEYENLKGEAVSKPFSEEEIKYATGRIEKLIGIAVENEKTIEELLPKARLKEKLIEKYKKEVEEEVMLLLNQ